MTTEELCRFLQLLALDADSTVLEVGSGAGGCALFMARQTGCRGDGAVIQTAFKARRRVKNKGST